MELTDRKCAIIEAVVKYHIQTGLPVGSKFLNSCLENAPSSATLRNEMSELSSLGFLTQPHTSAGRIPTSKGYEFYVSNIMEKGVLSPSVTEFIDSFLLSHSADRENFSAAGAKLVNNITGHTALSLKAADESVTVKSIKLMPLSSHVITLLVVMSDARSKSTLCKVLGSVDDYFCQRAEEILQKGLEGQPLDKLTVGTVQNITASAGDIALELMPLTATLFNIFDGLKKSDLSLFGQSQLYSALTDISVARRLLTYIEGEDGIINLLSDIKEGSIIFGSNTSVDCLNNMSVIVAPFGTEKDKKGRIGIIGPTRMAYDVLLPLINYIADKMSEIMGQSLKDLEE